MTARPTLYAILLSSAICFDAEASKTQNRCLMQSRRHILRTPSTPNLHELLPEPILALAWRLFEKEERIAELVENSILVDVTYAEVQMTLRINKADDAATRLGEESKWSSYDLDTLGDLQTGPEDMLNMIDVGGNYGIVSIAAYKKYKNHLRVISVEPIPTTFFFLKWNLFINGVPDVEESTLGQKSAPPGVFALNRGADAVDGEDLHFCFDPKISMNSRVCGCKQGEEHCLVVPRVTVDSLAEMFGNEESIAMVKMDCEGCEFKALPALVRSRTVKRVKRLAGELHLPSQTLEELACEFDKGRWMSKCQRLKNDDIECGVELSCPQ